MKKFFILAAAVCTALTACANNGIEKKTEEFRSKVDAVVTEFHAKVDSLGDDNDAIEKLYESTIETMKSLCIKTIRENRNTELAIEALKNIYADLELDELEDVLNGLGKKLTDNKFVLQLKKGIESRKTTAEGCKFTDFEVNGVKFSDYVGNGKYVLVDFWASWCGPCKREIPNIAEVYRKYHGPDFDVLSVAVWDKPENTAVAAAEHGVVWNQIVDAQKIPTDIYGIDGIPHIMLIGPDGTILRRDLRGEDIEKAVSEALGR